MAHVHTGHGPDRMGDCEGCEDDYWNELGRREMVISQQAKMVARLNACHRSGRQIDTGVRTLDSAADLYTYLVHGTYPKEPNARRQGDA